MEDIALILTWIIFLREGVWYADANGEVTRKKVLELIGIEVILICL